MCKINEKTSKWKYFLIDISEKLIKLKFVYL